MYPCLPVVVRQACEKIEEALVEAQVAIANLDLFVLYHAEFGKGAIKKCKISPDAFIQMALQLAYYKVQHLHDGIMVMYRMYHQLL